MKRAVFFDKEDDTLSADIRYVLEDVSKFELFNISKGYTPKQGDTIYLMPGVNIPRSKLKDLALDQGVKIVRDASNANIIITGKATPGKVLHGNWYHSAPISTVEKYLDLVPVDEYYKDNLRTALASSESDVAYFSYSTKINMTGIVPGAFNQGINSSGHFYYIEDEWKEEIDDCQNKAVYDESELLAMINGDDAITITNEVYTQLREMFKSSDKDNHIMAMEIMANSNYVESALYLLMLLEEYGHRIADCHTKNHVNFKSMVSYFNLRVRDLDYLDPDAVSKKLVDLGLLTTEWLNILFESRINWFITNIARSTTFSVASIVPTSEVLVEINSEYRAEIKFDDKDNPCIESFSVLNDLSTTVQQEPIEEEAETEVIVEAEILIDNTLSNELPAPPEEIILDLEPVSNNNQIETNESTDIDWF